MIYFASDLHLGAPNFEESRRREDRFVAWLNAIKADATALYIVGDLFDFWLEYQTVVPKGYIRILGKFAELRDSGLPIYFFTGNHDLWMNDYFETELGIPIYRKPITTVLNGKTFMIGHGDGLGPGDRGYKLMKRWLFLNPFCQWLLRWLHPDIGIRIASFFSRRSRLYNADTDAQFLGNEGEWLVQYAKRKLQQQHIDFFVFGHRHLPLQIPLTNNSLYINLGDWIQYNTYATYDGNNLQLRSFSPH